ncbi:Xaa-Pro aminopeptidase 1 [Halocaridina rubra]|uniref:Xaa-Pro aminopeptidase 1 n=1 Tax=Halocaridina rubra TaxID=373956 RepID=A0AAN9A608_HALRR
MSTEPGYYKDGEFGIRLENIMTVVNVATPHNFKKMIGFEAVTLVPYEANLIDTTLLNQQQCDWLNEYHTKVRTVVGAEMQRQNRTEGHEWVHTKTKPLCSSAASFMASAAVLLTALYISLINRVC